MVAKTSRLLISQSSRQARIANPPPAAILVVTGATVLAAAILLVAAGGAHSSPAQGPVRLCGMELPKAIYMVCAGPGKRSLAGADDGAAASLFWNKWLHWQKKRYWPWVVHQTQLGNRLGRRADELPSIDAGEVGAVRRVERAAAAVPMYLVAERCCQYGCSYSDLRGACH